jgi:hypothetical protein
MRHVFRSAVGWSHQEAENARAQATRRAAAAATMSVDSHGRPQQQLHQQQHYRGGIAYTVPTPVDQRIAAVYSNTRDEVMALVKVQVAAATEEAARQAQMAEQQRHFAAAVREAAEAQAAIKAADDARRAAANTAIAERRKSMMLVGENPSGAAAAAAAASGKPSPLRMARGGGTIEAEDGFFIFSPMPPQTPSSFASSVAGASARFPRPGSPSLLPPEEPLQRQWPQPPPSSPSHGRRGGGGGGGGTGPAQVGRGRRGIRLSLRVSRYRKGKRPAADAFHPSAPVTD